MTYVHMSCCGGVLGEHRFGCEDSESALPEVWPARREGRIVWLCADDESIHYASHDEAREALEMSAEAESEATWWREVTA